MNATLSTINAFSGEINQQPTTLVNASDLHAHLGIKTRYSDWILRRIEEFGFVRNLDFIDMRKLERIDAGRIFGSREVEKTEYHITLDMAKELCMVERSEIGRAARRYFIEMEKESRDAVPTWAIEQWSVQQSQLAAAQDLALRSNPFFAKVMRYAAMGLSLAEMSRLLECGDSTVVRARRGLRAAGICVGAPAFALTPSPSPVGRGEQNTVTFDTARRIKLPSKANHNAAGV